MAERELIPMHEAAQRLGISRMTMSRLLKQGRFMAFENPLDQRQKLVDFAEVRAAVRPQPLSPEAAQGKGVAAA